MISDKPDGEPITASDGESVTAFDGEPIIRLKQVRKDFDGSTAPALSDLTADIPGGCIVGLVGPDAAGKTTLMRLLAGLMLPSSGEILVLGQTPGNPASKNTAPNTAPSIGYMPQRFGLYEDLSVKDNLELHAELRGLRGEPRKTTFERLLGFTGLAPFTGRLAGKLSGGMKQKLGLACALLTRPRLLLLDEPGVGVDPLSRRELWEMVIELIDDGVSVLWSTAYMDEAEQCAHVLMLDQGTLVYEGKPELFTSRVNGRVFALTPPPGKARETLALWQQREEVRDALIQGSRIRLVLETAEQAIQFENAIPLRPRLEDAYIDAVGGMDRRPSPFEPNLATKRHDKAESSANEPVIRAINLTKQFGTFIAARDISFEVLPGRIFGLLGPNGAGKSTTFRMLCGLSRPTRGECYVAGMNLLTAAGAARNQLGYMAQKCSLYGELTVRQNMRLIADLYGLPSALRTSRIEETIEALDLGSYHNTRLSQLPLGHRQRLGMACATLHRPPVLFLDEPTSGVDPRTRREFWKHINAMTRNGVAVLVTTHFMEEAEYCDEIALIFQGSMIAKGTPDALKANALTSGSEETSEKTPDSPVSPSPLTSSPVSPSPTLPTLEDAFIACIESVRRKTAGDS